MMETKGKLKEKKKEEKRRRKYGAEHIAII